ncbi:hypothetical protein C0995_016202 [Termitomyces sp. Mi166|nr:hypothetical protein C0995_016202 [Termitomyces sp. Mi166\
MTTIAKNPVVLYDIVNTKGNECWSPNVWRIRIALNYKQIPYRTKWVEYPDIGKVGKEIGARPTTPSPDGSGVMLWTCPMIIDPNHLDAEGKPTVVADSQVIIKYLDEVYPEIKAIPDGTAALHNVWLSFIGQNITGKLANLCVPLCPNILPPRSREYFVTTREKWWGPLDKMCPDRPMAWKEVHAGLNKVAGALDANRKRNEAHLHVIPGKLSYADFALVAPLLWAKSIISDKEFDALKGWNEGRWGKILDEFQNAGLLRVD